MMKLKITTIRYFLVLVLFAVIFIYIFMVIRNNIREDRLLPIADLEIIEHDLQDVSLNFELDENNLIVNYSEDLQFDFKSSLELYRSVGNIDIEPIESSLGVQFINADTSTDPYYGRATSYRTASGGFLTIHELDKIFIYSEEVPVDYVENNFESLDEVEELTRSAENFVSNFANDNFETKLTRVEYLAYPDVHGFKVDDYFNAGALLMTFESFFPNNIEGYTLSRSYKSDQDIIVIIRKDKRIISLSGPIINQVVPSGEFINLMDLNEVKELINSNEYLLTADNGLGATDTLQSITIKEIAPKYALKDDVYVPVYVADVELSSLQGNSTDTQIVINAVKTTE